MRSFPLTGCGFPHSALCPPSYTLAYGWDILASSLEEDWKMNIEKNNYSFNGRAALAIGLIISSFILGWSYKNSKKGDEAITVTGSAKKSITSDLGLWNARVSSKSPQLADAYKRASSDIQKIKQYL